jgi:enediyne biosynthesis protein E4
MHAEARHCTRAAGALATALLLLTSAPLAQAPKKPAGAPAVTFTDVTAAAGIRFTHVNGAFGEKYLPETMGSGVVVLDYDGDGWPDLFFVNSTTWPGRPGTGALPALYRNNGNGTFTDVTRAAGLAVSMYGMGAAAGDFDNDGHIDLFVTGVGGNRLFRNTGQGAFTDVTRKAGLTQQGFSASAAWVDVDNDGHLDLFVTNYVEWSLAGDKRCSLDGKTKSYCTPEVYQGAAPWLFRNRGNGTFEDVTRKAGLHDAGNKALGVALIDIDGNGRLDLFVANDTQPNRLYRNSGTGTFVDEAVAAGVAFSDTGTARAGMGVDAADWAGSGRQGLVIGNFSNEMIALYRNEGGGLFTDEAPASSIGRGSLLTLTFACFFFDADNDGRLDVFAANGHVADDIERVQPKITHAQPAHLFRSLGGTRFEDLAPAIPALAQPVVARGAAYLDFDNDGHLDLVVTTNNGPARLLRNAGGARGNALRVQLVGTASNRSAIGATVVATLRGGARQSAMVKSGSSYLSQSELPLTFGLGQASNVEGLEIRWPSGRVEKLAAENAGQTIVVHEGKGVTARRPFGR